jgi:hypothetical protein
VPTASIFNSARQKLSRAKQHAVEFNEREQEFLRRACSGPVTETETSGHKVIRLKFSGPVPLEIASVVSDAVNNLRDCLDHAAYATAEVGLRGVHPRYASFPFAGSETQLENSIKGRSKEVPEKILDLFRTLKPYRGGDDQLYALNTLANADKHTMLRPMAVSTGSFSMDLDRLGGGMLGIGGYDSFAWDPARNEIIIARYTKDSLVDLSRMELQVYLVFDEATLEAGDPVGRILDVLAHKVETILASVEAESRTVGLIT